MIIKASTYLQIVLASEHQKKWYPKSVDEDQENEMKKLKMKKPIKDS